MELKCGGNLKNHSGEGIC